MNHYGNVTKINGAEVELVDVITFGSPCQDLSVAGKRAGIQDGERSNLFFEAVRIIKEMREATNGEYPKYAVWENVPGAFSSNKGHDFHAVLEALCSVCDDTVSIPKPYDAKRTKLVWNKAGEIVGDNYSIAWRTLDAQYWRVPQRRKRIYLVADFGGQRAGEILFKPDSLRGDLPQGNEKGQGVTADAMGGADGSVGVAGVVSKGNGDCFIMPERHMSLSVGGGQAGQGYPCTVYSFDSLSSNSMKSSNPFSGCRAVEVAKCIDTTYPDPSKNQGGVAVVVLNDQGGSSINVESEDVSPTLRANSHQHEPVIALQANGIDRADTAGCNGCGWRENESYTLNTVDRHAVCYQGQVGALQARDYKGVGSQYVGEDKLVVECYDARGNGDGETAAVFEPKSALEENWGEATAKNALRAGASKSSHAVVQSAKPPRKYIIRRLTPTECARLQGFPDWWGKLPTIKDMDDKDYEFWCEVLLTKAKMEQTARWDESKECYVVWQLVKPDKAKDECFEPYWRDTGNPYKDKTNKQMVRWYNKLHTDSAEYKMWGNGIALPNAEYVLHGIAEHGAKTLGSLFDGSGGFPLAGVLNGITPVWASEVEPYPIAVTKSRFMEVHK